MYLESFKDKYVSDASKDIGLLEYVVPLCASTQVP